VTVPFGGLMGRIAAMIFVALLACSAHASAADLPAAAPPVVPLPREMTVTGDDFAAGPILKIVAQDAAARDAAWFLVEFARDHHEGASVAVSNAALVGPGVRLVGGAHDAALGDEGYRLDVSAAGVTVAANTSAGLFYGVQTLEQLASSPDDPRGNRFTGVHIVDRPNYRWRGIHLDVSRHFFPVAVVERYIDLAARYKLNTFHWHLSDDQGWRLPIARYPRLTTAGGCRAGTQAGGPFSARTDAQRYCGSYTKSEVRQVVEFAARRHVTIVPEIEMPGHSVEALAAYPWLGCGRGPFAVRMLWGVSTEIFCPTERTFAFLDDVLRETAELFPGPYLHIGGDEVPKDAWEHSAAVAELMRREHLTTYDEVQGYFTRRVERIAAKYGKRIAGWDEIVAGDVSRGAVVMIWHGGDEAARAVRRGNDVVMTPGPPLYFDAYQGNPEFEPLAIGGLTALQRVYEYDPLPRGALTPEQRAHVLGVQANLWTEYIPTPEQLFYMALPRELALAEVAWTPRARLAWDGFSQRIGPALARLETEGVGFRIPPPAFRLSGVPVEFPEQQNTANRESVEVRGTEATVELRQAIPGATIRYTLDGTAPTAASPAYTSSLRVPVAAGQHAVVSAIVVLHEGRRSAPAFLELTARTP
jgi:hexosaminidase